MRRLLWWIIAPLLMLTAPSLAMRMMIGIAITFHSGSLVWLKGISLYEWLLMAAVATYCLLALVLRREDARRKQDAEDLRVAPPFVVFWEKFRRDLATVDEMSFEEVTWTVTVPIVEDADGRFCAASSPPELVVRLPANCPKCGFGLKETKLGRALLWQCTACSFRRLSRRRFGAVAGRMEGIARQAWQVSQR